VAFLPTLTFPTFHPCELCATQLHVSHSLNIISPHWPYRPNCLFSGRVTP
jgi:hypothetical protein